MARGGTLFVVATPLGHLGDLTARAAELLRSVPVVAAEDTRRTRALLSHLDAHPRLLAYHAHAGPRAAGTVLRALEGGDDVALVTDAGTPAVSDPGVTLVAAVRSAGYRVVPLPGASAVAAALSAAGLPADRYVFLGFLPRKGAERARLLERIRDETLTMVLFEAPGRVRDLVGELADELGDDRPAVLAREMTKIHEEFTALPLGELVHRLSTQEEPRGECTLVIAGRVALSREESPLARRAAERLLSLGVGRREAQRFLTELLAVSRNEAYRVVNSEQ